jgi:DNA-binding transcriptional regulator LsrR (DeoR family)
LQPSNELSHDAELLSRVASLYYLEDITQAEIATMLGLSRPKVGRLLKRARDEGVVEITVHAHPALNMELEATLMARFGLQQVLLAADQRDAARQRALVAQLLAGYLNRTLQDNMVVAVGMGRNIGAVPDQLLGAAERACTFVPALGGSPLIGQPINPDEVCRRLAERFGGDSESLYAPAYAENAVIRDSFMSHETIRRTLDRARRADIALVGIGDARDDSAVVRIGCFSFQEMRHLRQAGAVGDMLGFFFDIHGVPVAHSMEHRVVGLGADDLRRIPCVIAVASEADKATAILGALRTGIINILATSTGNAHNILALDAEERS